MGLKDSFLNKISETKFRDISNADNKVTKMIGKANDAFADAQVKLTKKNSDGYEMYEAFGGGYVTFALTDRSLIYKKEEIPYSEIDEIILTIPPSKLRVGAANALVGDRSLLMQYSLGQSEEFARMYSHAVEQMQAAKGITPNYMFSIQSPDGTRIEAYQDYMEVSRIDDGFFGNSLDGGAKSKKVPYSQIDVDIQPSSEPDRKTLQLKSADASVMPSFNCPLLPDEVGKANQLKELVSRQ